MEEPINIPITNSTHCMQECKAMGITCAKLLTETLYEPIVLLIIVVFIFRVPTSSEKEIR